MIDTTSAQPRVGEAPGRGCLLQELGLPVPLIAGVIIGLGERKCKWGIGEVRSL